MATDTFNNLPASKRERIMHIAMDEFAENSYQAASVSKIVRKAGIAKGSFYQYFEDKRAFYRYLIEVGTQEKLKLIKSLPAPNPNSDLFVYMRWQFLAQVYFELQQPQLAKVLYRAFIEDVPFPDMNEELQRRGTTQFFKQLLSQGIIHGSVSPFVDPDVAAFITEVIFYQFGRYFIDRLGLTDDSFTDSSILDNPEAQALLNNLMDILEAGMKRNPEQRHRFTDQA